MSVEQIYEAISGWAGVPTWYTSHPLDEKRFNSAIHTLIETVGTDITHAQFEEALRRHVSNNPPTLGEPTEWDKLIDQYSDKAMAIISYESSQ
tara:strand:+ start:2756 stop:3034 length:279 start_codon:yes stop_codon:yes gene_type:complete